VDGSALRCPRISRVHRGLSGRVRFRPSRCAHPEHRVGHPRNWRSRRWSAASTDATDYSRRLRSTGTADSTAALSAGTAVSTVAECAAAGADGCAGAADDATGLRAAAVSGSRSSPAFHVHAMRDVARTARSGADGGFVTDAGHGGAPATARHADSRRAAAARAGRRIPSARPRSPPPPLNTVVDRGAEPLYGVHRKRSARACGSSATGQPRVEAARYREVESIDLRRRSRLSWTPENVHSFHAAMAATGVRSVGTTAFHCRRELSGDTTRD
jgi:hypothetical protein